MTRAWRFDHVEYLSIDLNDDAWPGLERWLGDRSGSKTLVLMEGVSLYVNNSTFGQYLWLLAAKLSAGSHIAYDFKLRGVNDDFGRDRRTQRPFRLSRANRDVVNFHEAHGLRLDRMELSSELCVRLLPALAASPAALFSEDALVQLQVKCS